MRKVRSYKKLALQGNVNSQKYWVYQEMREMRHELRALRANDDRLDFDDFASGLLTERFELELLDVIGLFTMFELPMIEGLGWIFEYPIHPNNYLKWHAEQAERGRECIEVNCALKVPGEVILRNGTLAGHFQDVHMFEWTELGSAFLAMSLTAEACTDFMLACAMNPEDPQSLLPDDPERAAYYATEMIELFTFTNTARNKILDQFVPEDSEDDDFFTINLN